MARNRGPYFVVRQVYVNREKMLGSIIGRWTLLSSAAMHRLRCAELFDSTGDLHASRSSFLIEAKGDLVEDLHPAFSLGTKPTAGGGCLSQ
ncbi:hypothetical protein AG1IA_06816 [Rhizoctonia solani AG-1 IA]|uniref:Uncharacterized protein n=1 Tax=Thanatephorus cucumeris (strain AG1-IA) TaxID=983506 RepID=L8WMG6_THACA|nr:hypothetical protein AG1IA_06816 [Rhizoctonia solani AG-1 IA]